MGMFLIVQNQRDPRRAPRLCVRNHTYQIARRETRMHVCRRDLAPCMIAGIGIVIPLVVDDMVTMIPIDHSTSRAASIGSSLLDQCQTNSSVVRHIVMDVPPAKSPGLSDQGVCGRLNLSMGVQNRTAEYVRDQPASDPAHRPTLTV